MLVSALCDELQLGFELEGYWPISFKHGSYVRQNLSVYLLKNGYTQEDLNWVKQTSFVVDHTLKDRLCHLYPAELVTPPLPYQKSRKLFLHLLEWMQNFGVKTTSNCGLHINVGFVNQFEAVKVDYLTLLQCVPQDKVLRLFERLNNEHCISTTNLIAAEGTDLFSWVNRQQKILHLPLTKSKNYLWHDYWGMHNNLLTGNIKEVEKLHYRKFFEKLSARLVSICVDAEKGHAVGDRSSYYGRYFEFRLMGNTDYHLRKEDCLGCLELFALSVLKSSRLWMTQKRLQSSKPQNRLRVLY